MKPFTVYTMPQGSAEWKAIRAGVFTASRAAEAFATTQKGAFTAKRKDLRTELVLARFTGKPKEDGYQSKAMLDGIKREASALRAYENIHGVIVRTCGFVKDNEGPIGCSPDGVLGDFEGLVQAKCPLQATHLLTFQAHYAATQAAAEAEMITGRAPTLLGCIPAEYIWQIRHELYVTGASWCDYFSYHPDFPEPLQAVTIRVTREDADLTAYAALVQTFLDEVEAESQELARMLG